MASFQEPIVEFNVQTPTNHHGSRKAKKANAGGVLTSPLLY
jgi:hypothetical protein